MNQVKASALQTELRIGNYLFAGVVCEIYEDSFTVFDGYQKWNSKKMVDAWIEDAPIPLTEEWLLKFGFDKYNFTDLERGFITAN